MSLPESTDDVSPVTPLADDDRLLRRGEVMEITSLSTTELYRRMKLGDFPRPRKLGAGHNGSVRWLRSEVLAWMSQLPVSAGATPSAAPEAA